MEKNFQIMKIFGFLEIGIAIVLAAVAITRGPAGTWMDVAIAGLNAFLLLSAVKDPQKYISGAWSVTLLGFLLALLDLVLLGKNLDTLSLVVYPIVMVANLIVFLAVNKVKNAVQKGQ